MEDEEGISVIRLRSWKDCPLTDLAAFTHASLSPSFHRLLLLSSSGSAKLIKLSNRQGRAEVETPVSSPAFGTPIEVSTPFYTPCSALDGADNAPPSRAGLSSFTWGCQRDSYSEDGIPGPFQELLFTCDADGLVLYGFAKRIPMDVDGRLGANWLHDLPSLHLNAEVVADGKDLVLRFLESQCWPEVTAFKLSYDSASFTELLRFSDQEEGGSWSIVKLVSNSTNSMVGMLMESSTDIQVVLLITISGWELRWETRIQPRTKEKLVDLALVGEKLLGLAGSGQLFFWSASTGEYLRLLDLSSHCGVDRLQGPVTGIFATESVSLVGIIGHHEQIFLVPLDDDAQPLVCHWEMAASEIWHYNWFTTKGALGPSAFTPKRLLTRMCEHARVERVRTMLMPLFPDSSLVTAAVSPYAVTRLFKSADKITLVQSRLKSSAADAEFYVKDLAKVYAAEVLGCSFQGLLYLVTESSLYVVLPPLSAQSKGKTTAWWRTTVYQTWHQDIWGEETSLSLPQWKVEILDRVLIYDGLEEAEHLASLNGWSIRFTRLRKLQLSLKYGRTSEIARILDKLVPVGGAEAGVPRVIFAALDLMTNRFGTDNELGQATRLLSIIALFTKKLIRCHGVRETHGLVDLSRFLEAIRTLQERLRQNGPKTEKGDSQILEKIDSRKFAGSDNILDSIKKADGGSSSALVEVSAGEIMPWKDPSVESPREMVIRWDKENVDLKGIVKDALRAGRIPLAVVQLHQRRLRASPGASLVEDDIFKEIQNTGKSIVYELLCKGKVPIALAALRRLGEDIRLVLYDLAFGTVRRSLRVQAARELKRHGHLDAASHRLMQTISYIESAYPSERFWQSYNIRLDTSGKSTVKDADLHLCCSTSEGSYTISCGEVDGVVLGSWSEVVSNTMEEEWETQPSPSYWAIAAVWFREWDQQTIDRIILERTAVSSASGIAWKSQFAYHVVHHSWQNVLKLSENIPSSELQDSELQVTLDKTVLLEGSSVPVVEVVNATIPGVKVFTTEIEVCTSWLRERLELSLARDWIFLRANWRGTMELLSVLAKLGSVFNVSSQSPTSETDIAVNGGLHQLVIRLCVDDNLPCMLELYLDQRKLELQKIDFSSAVAVADGTSWALWLLWSYKRGCEYEASFANARAVLSTGGTVFSSLSDLAKYGSEILALSTVMYAPVVPQKCLISGARRHATESWHCSMEYLRPSLRHFPSLWENLKLFCYGKSADNDIVLPSYLVWRKSMFSSSNGDITLLDMLPKWLPSAFRKLVRVSAEGPPGEPFVDPHSWEAAVAARIQMELSSLSTENLSTVIERYLLQGRPLAAFGHLTRLRSFPKEPGDFPSLNEGEEEVLNRVPPLALANFTSTVIPAACACFIELCGVSASMLRTDVAVLQRIHSSKGEDLSESLVKLLSDEYLRRGVRAQPAYSDVAASLLRHLERATLKGDLLSKKACGSWLKNGEGDGQQLRAMQLSTSDRWSLVTAFCRIHNLPPSTTYLSHLAADNDWVGFLAEAQAESCPLDVLISVASNHFSDEQLRSHILIVLRSLISGQASAVDSFEGSSPSDLFDILARAEHQRFPGKELLQRAKVLHWPLLAVVASCFGDVTPLLCLTTWLEVTAAREPLCINFNDGASHLTACVGAAVDATNAATNLERNSLPAYVRVKSKRRRIGEVQDAILVQPIEENRKNKQSSDHSTDVLEPLAKMVSVLCEHQRFVPLLRAFELFLPASPLLHFIRFLRAFSQMRLSEASSHLADFSTLLREEMHSKGGKVSTGWISEAAVAGADAMLRACPSVYEKRCMLQLLAAADFGDGGFAAVRYRRLYWKVQLAEPSLHQDGYTAVRRSDLDDDALLSALEKAGEWEQARSWARQLDFGQQSGSRAVDHVTEMQAEAMVAEWKELLWDMPEQRAALWRHCQALFTKHSYPPLKAGNFFMKHAEDIEQNGSPSELHAILLLALQWLSGSITGSAPVYPVSSLRELETRVWLLAVESEVLMQSSGANANISGLNIGSSLSLLTSNGSPVDRTAAKIAVVDSHLKAYNSIATSDESRQLEKPQITKEAVPKLKRRLVKRVYNGPEKEQSPGGSESSERRGGEGLEEAAGWEDKVGEGEVERAILALLEVGQVPAARQLQQKLSPGRVPMELLLCEAALAVAMLSTPMMKGSVGTSLVGPAVLKTLNNMNLLKDVSSASPLQVMEALTAACRDGCGRGHCRRISAVAQVANFLGLPFYEAYQKQATELLQLLALKGQDALAEAKLLVATHSINPASIARLLAESFLKGLLAAHRGGYMESSAKEEGPAPLLWRPSDFVQWGQLCPSEPELGHALMRLVISGHDMPHACEVELLILAHQFYESSACLDGMDVLVALAATRVESYLSEGDFTALARLVTGVSNFQALRFVLDLLIENGQLQLLLKKRASMDASSSKESSASLRGFRMAVLSALKHFNPHDLDAFGMVFSHFSMAHEMANLLESRGKKGLSVWYLRSSSEQTEQNEETLDVMRLFVEASEVYAGIDCGNRTRWCCAQASLLSLQLRMPETAWLNLGETGARCLLVEQRRFGEALVVAEGYGLNQPAEWVSVLWTQVLSPSHWIDHFLQEFTASLPLSAATLMELARIYRIELGARASGGGDFSKWLSTAAGATPDIVRSFRCVLRRVHDFRLRTQVATLASGFPDVLDACARVLDKVPDTAGPLVLKRGHGGTYVPVM